MAPNMTEISVDNSENKKLIGRSSPHGSVIESASVTVLFFWTTLESEPCCNILKFLHCGMILELCEHSNLWIF